MWAGYPKHIGLFRCESNILLALPDSVPFQTFYNGTRYGSNRVQVGNLFSKYLEAGISIP